MTSIVLLQASGIQSSKYVSFQVPQLGWVYLLSWELPPVEFQDYRYRTDVATFTSLQKTVDYILDNGMNDVIIDVLPVDLSFNTDGDAKYLSTPPTDRDDFPRRVRNGKLI